jgi:endo-beta-N-acetylglucosaminidase D
MGGTGKYEKKGTGIFNWTLPTPFAGIAGSKDEASELAARVVNIVVPELRWLTKHIGAELELDIDDYSVYVSGSPVVIDGMGGSAIGYSIHVSIYPRYDPETREGDTGVAGHS